MARVIPGSLEGRRYCGDYIQLDSIFAIPHEQIGESFLQIFASDLNRILLLVVYRSVERIDLAQRGQALQRDLDCIRASQYAGVNL